MTTLKQKLSPILKRAGGKEKELKHIVPNLPNNYKNYYEPFVGGGAVYFSLKAEKYHINDKSEDLIGLYNVIISKDRKIFFSILDEIVHNRGILDKIVYNNSKYLAGLYKDYSKYVVDDLELNNRIIEFILSHAKEFNGMFEDNFNYNIRNYILELEKNLVRKIKRMRVLEEEKGKLPKKDILSNIETALKSAFYMHFRYLYNNKKKYNLNNGYVIAIFLFIRNYAYSGMFRYNKAGDFNVPYGGIGYNNKNFEKKIKYLKSKQLRDHLEKTLIVNKDFEVFFNENKPQKNDFIFLDPPYDSEFSTYDKNIFDRKDQKRLSEYLIEKCHGKWMMIIKNTEYIYDLYNNKGLKIKIFDKKYLVSFMNRNDKDVEHLLITNY